MAEEVFSLLQSKICFLWCLWFSNSRKKASSTDAKRLSLPSRLKSPVHYPSESSDKRLPLSNCLTFLETSLSSHQWTRCEVWSTLICVTVYSTQFYQAWEELTFSTHCFPCFLIKQVINFYNLFLKLKKTGQNFDSSLRTGMKRCLHEALLRRNHERPKPTFHLRPKYSISKSKAWTALTDSKCVCRPCKPLPAPAHQYVWRRDVIVEGTDREGSLARAPNSDNNSAKKIYSNNRKPNSARGIEILNLFLDQQLILSAKCQSELCSKSSRLLSSTASGLSAISAASCWS